MQELVSNAEVRKRLEKLRAARKADAQAAQQQQQRKNSAWTNPVAQRVQRSRSAPLREPTVLVEGIKPKQSPWATAESRVMIDVYEEHAAQRARREQEDEQEASEILDDEQTSSPNPSNGYPLPSCLPDIYFQGQPAIAAVTTAATVESAQPTV